MDKITNAEYFNQIAEAILAGKYSWACVLFLRSIGYNPVDYIPYRTYNRLLKENCQVSRPSSAPLQDLETEIREALKHQRFQIHYQPIVSLQTGRITGFEALVRLWHPQHGLILPAEFIPVAEATGLIIPLNCWVLHEACRQMRAWQAQFKLNQSLTLSVNLSSKQFTQPELSEQIRQILKDTDLDGSNLNLEFPQSVIRENSESVISQLCQLRYLGVQLHMVNFDAGDSCLSCLHCVPIDTVKLDHSFVRKLSMNDKDSEAVGQIATLIRTQNINAIAQGVETVEQLKQLKALGCKYGQGHLFSKPVNDQAAMMLLAQERQ
jgi:EAL domain-containing protein (putative c-di-GMP-specific phosphodiesterase class I)